MDVQNIAGLPVVTVSAFLYICTFEESLKIDRDSNFVNIDLEPVAVVQKVNNAKSLRLTCTVLNLLFHWSPLTCTSIVFRDRGIVLSQSFLFSQPITETIFQSRW